jgi:LmbE family N-acetylglucosaminyl deacetylase
MNRKKTVLVVVAHADDLEFMAGGTVARFVREFGYDVFEYILTDNGRGSYRLPVQELIQVSAREAVEAGEVLGLKEVRLDRYQDGELNQENPNVLREKVMRMIREVKADIVMSWDPFAPYEEHPDHRVISMATLEAASFSGNPLFYPEHPFDARPVTEAYWFAKHPWNAELFVDISSTIDAKIDALLKHDCQMALTVDGFVQEAKVLGIEIPELEKMALDGYLTIMGEGMRGHAAKVGTIKGFAFAEQFRYERLGLLDVILGSGHRICDFPA